YHVPYIHIGADEVKITNRHFVPEVTAYLESMGKKVIGWEPGGNFNAATIRQLWMDDNAHIVSNDSLQYIDSRHFYLNHMDPLEAVVTIFNRKIANRNKGDANALGATLCMWPDRAVAQERDILHMNPVYPGIIAFADKCWNGGGYNDWQASIGEPGSERAETFTRFEKKLLDHKVQYFSSYPFPYVQQAAMTWQLYGPY